MKTQIEQCEACRGLYDGEILWECLPVPLFGNPRDPKVKVATIAINPAASEFFIDKELTKIKVEQKRLPMLKDYDGKTGRKDLGPDELKKARERRDYYFCDAQQNRRSFHHEWFDPLEDILKGLDFGWSYFNGSAIHFDLVACTTKKAWRYVPNVAQKALQQNCGRYFRQTLSDLPSGTILLSYGVEPKDIPVDLADKKIEEKVVGRPPIKVWHGSISHDNRWFAFVGWRLSLKNLLPDQKQALVNWLQEHC